MEKEEKILKIIKSFEQLRPMRRTRKIDFFEGGMRFALNYLYDNSKREIFAGDIAKKLNVSTARVANLIKKLASKNLIYIDVSSEDGRKRVVSLTEQGREATEKMRKEHNDELRQLIEDVGTDDMEEYIRIQLKIRESIKRRHFSENEK